MNSTTDLPGRQAASGEHRPGFDQRPAADGAEATTASSARARLTGQVLRFTAVGVVCTLASMGLFAFLRPSLGPQWANALALISTSVLNTALNRAATFRIKDRRGAARDQARGLIVMGIAWVITASSLVILHWFLPHASVTEELWTTTLAGFLATVVRFALFRQWIFRRAKDA
ncbi:GtrA family protein [Arthrobacter sp. NPDC090010]|uniref:GtrA family protein n=1 Tax=Arthrobacter sp. NPDC090010 TaxID=3363942 RepID=UPI0037FD7AD5